MDNILWFKDISENDLGKAGGKGLNLGIMYNIPLPIPAGFVVTAGSYKKFLDYTRINEQIMYILKKTNVDDNEELQKASKMIKEIILNAKMPSDIVNDIIEAYDNLNVNNDIIDSLNIKTIKMIKAGRDLPFVAVRSSATAEDLPSISENEYVFVKINSKPFFGKMKELAEIVKPDNEICIPAMDNFEVKWKKISNIYKHKVDNKYLFKITTATGKQITISPNHTLIVLDEETLEPKVIEIGELKDNDKLPVIKSMPNSQNINSINIIDYIDKENVVEYNDKLYIKNNSNNWKIQYGFPKNVEITKNFAYFLGVFTAEGTTYKDNGIIITNTNKDIINRIKRFLNILGLNSETKINKYSLRIYCKVLTRFLNENCCKPNEDIKGKGKTCGTKEVPSFIFCCSEEIIGEYIKGCFDGDGTVDKKAISYTTTSEKLIIGLSILFQRLNIEFYINRNTKKKAFYLNLPLKEMENFMDKISFFNIKKLNKANMLIKNYKNSNMHFEFKNSIKVSKVIANKIRFNIEENLPKQKIIEQLCPLCTNKLEKNNKYKGLKRYYCINCRKTFYEDKVINQTVEKYVYYDKKGRFLKGSTPWNKSINTYPTYGINRFKEIVNSQGTIQLLKVFSESIIWDKIANIEKIKYDSWVYDFCIPCVENFATGSGGIITHNSASFAGQQETFLNVKGVDKVVKAVQGCWASLFTARAIYYREKNNFPHEKVLIAVVIQKMVDSDSSGVMFSVNPATNNTDEIMIEAAFGLGEVVVGGRITPDTYIIDKETLKIKSKKIAVQPYALLRNERGGNIEKNLSKEEGSKEKIDDNTIIKLAEYAKKIEDYYEKAQDIEWATEKNRIYIVQSRAVTTLMKKREESEKISGDLKPILEGLGASPGIAEGKVKIVSDVSELSKIMPGDILVAVMTNPDFVAGMKRAAAIVTNDGGLTCHAAIVSREMGIPAIVGTEKATKILKENQLITVDATSGKVYDGSVKIGYEKKEEEREEHVPEEEIKTITKVYMNLGEPEKIEDYKNLQFDGIGLMRIEFIISSYIGKHPLYLIENNNEDFYIDKLIEGISKVASVISPKPVVVRFSDFKSNEYRGLEGGDKFEPHEDNPLIGWRGVSRYISEDFIEAFKLECRAIKKVRAELKNIYVMLPFVRTIDEVKRCLEIMKSEGLEREEDFKIWLMAEVPSLALIPEEFAKLDIDGVSIGSNDLTMLVLGVDRDSAKLGKMGYFDERNKAVLKAIENIIEGFHKHVKTVSICGQSVSVYSEVLRFVLKHGIDSVSVNPDVVNKVRKQVAEIEEILRPEGG